MNKEDKGKNCHDKIDQITQNENTLQKNKKLFVNKSSS